VVLPPLQAPLPPVAGEPLASALILSTVALLLAMSALLSRASERTGIPVLLIFLLLGMLAGSEGIGGIAFEDYHRAFRVGMTALVLILFDGGLNTDLAAVREHLKPAAVLATLGVVLTAALVAVIAIGLGLPKMEALLLGAVVSSTDASAVFSVLRSSGLSLRRRIGVTLEVESGINDPMAVILTATITEYAIGAHLAPWQIAFDVLVQLVVGLAGGVMLGYAGRAVLTRVRLPAGGLYPVLTLAIALLAFGLPTAAGGSGVLAVYVAALILGNGPLPYRGSLLKVHDALAWLSQIVMFLLLGLLVFPSHLIGVAPLGLLLALALAFIARPLSVFACLLPFRYRWRELVYVGWVGLRGSVPIILATVPVLAGVTGASHLFDLVFFVVVAGALLPGATVPWITRRLELGVPQTPLPPADLAIESRQALRGDLKAFYIDASVDACGVPLAELPFPEGASVAVIVRGQELIAPRGSTTLQEGDHVFVISRREDLPLVLLLFGRPVEE
jgi:cell volume regulation protein A